MLETANYRLTNVELYGMDAGELREHLAAYFVASGGVTDPYSLVVADLICCALDDGTTAGQILAPLVYEHAPLCY